MEITPPRTVIKFHSKQKQSVISQKYKKYTGILCAFLHLYSLSGIYYIHTQNNGHFFIIKFLKLHKYNEKISK